MQKPNKIDRKQDYIEEQLLYMVINEEPTSIKVEVAPCDASLLMLDGYCLYYP